MPQTLHDVPSLPFDNGQLTLKIKLGAEGNTLARTNSKHLCARVSVESVD